MPKTQPWRGNTFFWRVIILLSWWGIVSAGSLLGVFHTTGPLLRNRNLGGKFQNGDLIFDTRNISLYELLSKACISYKTLIVLGGSSPLFCRSSFCSGWGEDLWKAQGQENMGLL